MKSRREIIILTIALGMLAFLCLLNDIVAAGAWVAGMFGGWYVGVTDAASAEDNETNL